MIYKTLHRLRNMNPRKTKVKLSCSWRVCSYCSNDLIVIVSWLQWWNTFLNYKSLSLRHHHIRVSLFRCIWCKLLTHTQSWVFCAVVCRSLFVLLSSFLDHCNFCFHFTYGVWFPLWFLQTSPTYSWNTAKLGVKH